ncbi:SubName: Full=Uncharacterized protein {ECO:0000313/EMBL:CCA76743.1} [Serendipita indica DSM 11827]|uniref:Protein kinase domain-containing protein n=1 Tax=Serendipita indica (strain DSM 11827) TaxID=1109443 RepID=G4TZK0_SERID|nr:SubName: Full=Uncharacterized protein {ECO:0000313/EMBL:CCA76743.1} [Serendipita indica DSM 11827]CCA76743.1 hypothetical protein PIIN_10731 [Serendipita indica DSM 11827]
MARPSGLQPESISSSVEKPKECRRLDWLLLKEVGTNLSNVRDSKELVQVILDAEDAHESVCDVHILHRDVSSNSILITLDASKERRRGLLIDWEMAKDMHDEGLMERPSITGTLMFMAIALNNRPLHQPWHDLESMFWVLFYFTLRHVYGVVFDGELLSGERRKSVLESFFNYDYLRSLSLPKKDLLQATTTVLNCHLFSGLLQGIRERLQSAYAWFDMLSSLEKNFKSCGANFRASNNQYQDLEKDVENAHLVAGRSIDLEAIVDWREAEIMRLKTDPRVATDVAYLGRQLARARLNITDAQLLDHDFFRLHLKAALDAGEETRCIPPHSPDPELDDVEQSHLA